jgi:hypothetical protein
MPMSPSIIKSQASPLLRIALLILGAAVFAWGLHYKLSLYETSQHPNPVSVAKLIQGEQNNKKIDSIQLGIRCPFSHLEVDSNVSAFRPAIVIRRNRQPDEPVYTPLILFPSVHFFRPPPRSL